MSPAFWWLLVGALVNSFGGFVLPFLVTYTESRGAPVTFAGLTLTAYGAGAVVAALAGGELCDRLGSRATIAVSMTGGAAAMAGLGLSSGLPLLAAAALAGLFGNMFRPASGALIADLVGPGGRVGAYAAYRLAINLGAAAGSGVAGLLADRSFALLFAGDAATSLVFAGVAVVKLRGPHIHEAEPAVAAVAVPARGGLLRDVPFLVFLAGAFTWWLVFYQGVVGLPLQVRALGYPNAAVGGLLAVNGALIVCGELPLTRLTRRLPRGPAIAAGAILIGAGFALLSAARSLPALVGTVVVWTAGEALVTPLATASAMDAAPRSLAGRYLGAWTMTRSMALLVAPAAGTVLFARSPLLLWLLCGAAGVAAAALVLTAGAMRRRAAL